MLSDVDLYRIEMVVKQQLDEAVEKIAWQVRQLDEAVEKIAVRVIRATGPDSPLPSWPDTLLVVFDLDGTLADDSHRRHFIEDPTHNDDAWGNYFRACTEDKPIEPACMLFRRLSERSWINQPTKVEIWSGRSEEVREETVAWLRRHKLQPSRLLMRARNDARMHTALKGEWLAAEKCKPYLAVEHDRNAAEWWRQQGVFAMAARKPRS